MRGELMLLFGVDLRKPCLRVPRGGCCDDRRESPARSAPGGPKIDHGKGAAVDGCRESGVGQFQDRGSADGRAIHGSRQGGFGAGLFAPEQEREHAVVLGVLQQLVAGLFGERLEVAHGRRIGG
jgi:hypothetical protein